MACVPSVGNIKPQEVPSLTILRLEKFINFCLERYIPTLLLTSVFFAASKWGKIQFHSQFESTNVETVAVWGEFVQYPILRKGKVHQLVAELHFWKPSRKCFALTIAWHEYSEQKIISSLGVHYLLKTIFGSLQINFSVLEWCIGFLKRFEKTLLVFLSSILRSTASTCFSFPDYKLSYLQSMALTFWRYSKVEL